MIIDHTHPLYKKKQISKDNKYNGAYYYSRDIVKYFIPHVNTDRNWVTVRLEEVPVPSHSVVFVHNNRNPNYYNYLKKYDDVVLVCSTKHTYDNMKLISEKVILLPLSVNVKSVARYRVKEKTKDMAFAGRLIKKTNQVPSRADVLTSMPQSKLIQEMAKYKTIYAVGRTAIQAKILGCEIGVYDNMYPDPSVWKVLDCSEAVDILQQDLDKIDGIIREKG